MSFSVSERHGLPQATQVRFRTASVDSAKSLWPVASPCDCASATERSCTPQTLHFKDNAADIVGISSLLARLDERPLRATQIWRANSSDAA
jgi:hypothetical protein